MDRNYIDIVFDRPPGIPSPRFVEAENPKRESINVGEWVKRSDGYHVLRIPKYNSALTKHLTDNINRILYLSAELRSDPKPEQASMIRELDSYLNEIADLMGVENGF